MIARDLLGCTDPWKSAKGRLVGVAAFSGSFFGSSLILSERWHLIPPTSGYPTKSVGQAANRWVVFTVK
jgi:hypothetical protein